MWQDFFHHQPPHSKLTCFHGTSQSARLPNVKKCSRKSCRLRRKWWRRQPGGVWCFPKHLFSQNNTEKLRCGTKKKGTKNMRLTQAFWRRTKSRGFGLLWVEPTERGMFSHILAIFDLWILKSQVIFRSPKFAMGYWLHKREVGVELANETYSFTGACSAQRKGKELEGVMGPWGEDGACWPHLRQSSPAQEPYEAVRIFVVIMGGDHDPLWKVPYFARFCQVKDESLNKLRECLAQGWSYSDLTRVIFTRNE